jgi:hypothetical protein
MAEPGGLQHFLAALRAQVSVARQAGDLALVAEIQECADELEAAAKDYEAAAATKLSLFEQAEHIDKALGRAVLELHEHAADYASGPALAATERLNAALARCQALARVR